MGNITVAQDGSILTIERTIKAARHNVWQAWTSKE